MSKNSCRKHVVAYSGGHSSANVAMKVVEKFGKENTILLNHDICARVEAPDVKYFKKAVADKLGLPITYANHPDWETKDQFDISIELRTWVNITTRQALCTTKLKTEPFKAWLKENYNQGDVVYYGFDANEMHRVQRRASIMALDGQKTDYPLVFWDNKKKDLVREAGINKPCQYGVFKHANCIGCLKAGWQHWYIVYAHRKDIWEKAKKSEEIIDHSIHKDFYLEEKEELFRDMVEAGVPTTEHIKSQTFWAIAKKNVRNKVKNLGQSDMFNSEFTVSRPCECSF